MQKRLGLDLEISDEFGYWMVGFTDGEGCFSARIVKDRKYKTLTIRFEIGVRADDKHLLEYIQNMLGVGKIYLEKPKPPRKPSPFASYKVFRVGDLYHVIVPLFDRYPLRSKKALEFQIWKELVHIRYHGKRDRGAQRYPGKGRYPHPPSYWTKVEPLVKQLKQGRKFSP